MGVRAVFIEFALAVLKPELTELSLVVIVLHIHHLKDKFSRQRLIIKDI